MNKLALFCVVACFVVVAASVSAQPAREIRDDLKKYFEAYKVDGSFVLFDLNKEEYVICNERQFREPFIPASTFKICNSLIGLETGVIPNENYVIKWDGVVRPVVAWNRDQDMKTAFRNSTVPYYQELARRVEGQRMQYWLKKAGYGNADTSGGIDRFWLTGGLRITPEQQIGFLRRLYGNNLPFSNRTMSIVKTIMIFQDTTGRVLRAKTGWSEQGGKNIGWFVGYLETKGNVYFFSTCIQTADAENNDFGRARTEITMSIFRELGLM